MLIRDISQDKTKVQQYFNNILFLRLSATVIVVFVLTATIFIWNYSYKINISLIIMCIFIICTSFFTFCRSFFRAFEKIKYEAISILIEKISAILFAAGAILLSMGLFGFLVGLTIGNFLCLVYCLFILLKKIIHIKIEFDISIIKDILKKSIPFVIMDIFVLIYFRMASIMIMVVTGSENQVGLYNSSYRIIEMFLALPSLMVVPIYPVISRTYLLDRRYAIEISEKTIKMLLILSFFLSTIIFFDYYRINEFLFSAQYREGAQGLRIIILTTIPLCINVLFGTILAAIDKQKFAAISVGINALINLILSYFLINQYQYLGATIAITLSEGLIALFYAYYIVKYFGKLKIIPIIFKLIFISILIGIMIIFLQNYNVNIIYSIILSGIIFMFLLFIFNILKLSQIKDFITLLRQV